MSITILNIQDCEYHLLKKKHEMENFDWEIKNAMSVILLRTWGKRFFIPKLECSFQNLRTCKFHLL